MALPNTEKLTSQLSMMPDEALKRMAMMYKQDPYILPLVIAEDGRRKQVRMAGAAAQAQPQPKVVDQQVSQVGPMPETVGIGQLPAPNLARMADGGIVAFEEGGEVERYQNRGLVGLPGSTDTLPIYSQGAFGPQPGAAEGLPTFQRKLRETAAKVLDGTATPQEKAFVSAFGSSALEAVKQERDIARFKTEPDQSASETARLAGYKKALSDTAPTPITESDGTAPPSTGGANAAPSTGVASLVRSPEQYRQLLGTFQGQAPAADPFEAQTRELGQASTALALQRKQEYEKQMQEMGLLGVEREQRLKAREEKLGKQEGELGGLALLKAGFAMMSGTSPHAFANIGVGAQAGLEDYSKGKEKINDAKERLDDAFGRLEEARRGEKMLSNKEKRELQRDIDNTIVQTKKDVLAGAREAYGLQRQDASKMFDAYVGDRRLEAQIGAQERIAGQRAQMYKDIYGDQAKVRAEYGKLQSKVMQELGKDTAYQTATDAQKAQMMTNRMRQELLNNPFLAPFAQNLGFSSAPSGKVRDLELE